MAQKGTRDILKNKALVIIICVVGIAAVSYGVAKDDNVIFVIGILLSLIHI